MLPVASGTNCQTLKDPESLQGIRGPSTNNFELLMQKRGRAYFACESEGSMCVIMKCNMVLPGMAY